MSTTLNAAGRYWSSDLMRAYYEAEARGWTLKAATSTREAREQGGLFALHAQSRYYLPWAPIKASNSLDEVREFIRRR